VNLNFIVILETGSRRDFDQKSVIEIENFRDLNLDSRTTLPVLYLVYLFRAKNL